MNKFRYLNASEVDCRVAQINEDGCTILLYKDARCDMNMLDEAVGAENWQRKHEVIDGNLYCSVGIYFEGKGWVWKQDVGTESKTEAEKGQASDSFKRACFNWGIGRELYTAPFIYLKTGENITIEQNKRGQWVLKAKPVVTAMQVKDGSISYLEICDKGKVIYKHGKPVFDETKDNEGKDEELPAVDNKNDEIILDLAKKQIIQKGEHYGHTLEWLYKNKRDDVKKVYEEGNTDIKRAIEFIESKRKKAQTNDN